MARPTVTYSQLFINNEFVNSVSGKVFPVIDPSTGDKICDVQEADKADVDKAVKAAKDAFAADSAWRKLDGKRRGELLHKLADLITRDYDKLATLDSWNMGKSITDSRGDAQFAADIFRYYAGWADKVCGKTIPTDSAACFSYTRREPIGVAGIILPWNFPVFLVALKAGPALAAGCTLVVKPAEQTPLSALHIAALAKEAGFPPGVFNVVAGYGPTAGQAMSSHMDIDKVAFTGSTEVGRLIQEASAKSNLKRVSLELGGKSPFIIFDVDDATLQSAAQDTAGSIFGNSGQSCCASSRVFVHENVYERYLEKLKAIAESKVVGDPFDAKTTNGALISDEQFNKVLGYIKSGKEQGARCVTGGDRLGSKGYFVKPTVFADCKDDMKIAKEEIFGPVVSVFKFKEISEAINRANATTYGLAAGIYSNDINKVLNVAHSLEAGSVWVNCYEIVANQAPFGGYKQSGIGRELGEYGLHEYTEVKNVTIKMN